MRGSKSDIRKYVRGLLRMLNLLGNYAIDVNMRWYILEQCMETDSMTRI